MYSSLFAIVRLCVVLQLSAVSGNWLTNLFTHSQSKEAYDQVNADGASPNQGAWSHELIAAAAGYEAMKSYENKVAQDGQAPPYATMKELLAGFASAATDRLIETKGLDYIDAQKTKSRAIANAQSIAAEKYGSTGTSADDQQ